LNEITRIIDNLATFNIYVIIDLHQDMMSSQFNSYDGVPLWVMKELPKPKFPYPWPFKDGSKLVFEAYVTDACGFAFECLYRNKSSFQDYFLQYWSIVAKNLANRSSILAYELINEPWAGDVFANPVREF
jgi:endoglycosylceramidase